LAKGGSRASNIKGGNKKFQAPNPKQIQMTEIQNSKCFEPLEFKFGDCLEFGA
jgi:hypothetical protein